MRAIITYHSVDKSGSPISIDAESFARHVDWYASGRVRVVSLDELLASSADDCVAITFDDGFRNFATDAAPRLLDRGLPVTLFPVTDHVGRTNAWGGTSMAGIPDLDLLSWAEIRRLSAAGVAMGSHTRTHPRLTELEAPALVEELETSAARFAEELGQRPRWLAYPYGAVNREIAAVAGHHYRGALTTEHRPLAEHDDPLLLPRLDAYYFRELGALERWNSAGFKRSIWFRRQARRAKAAIVDRKRAG